MARKQSPSPAAPAEPGLAALERAVRDAAGEPDRVSALNALAHGLRNSDPKRALALANEAWRLASGANDPAGMAQSCHRRAYLKNVMGRYLDAIVNAQDAHRLYKKTGDRRGEAVALRMIGAIYANLSQNGKAAEFLERSRAISAALGDARQLQIADCSLAQILLTRGDGDGARRHFTSALASGRRLREQALILNALIGLGETEYRFGDRTAAGRLLRQALTAARKLGNRRRESECLNNLGELLLSRGRPAEALPLFASSRKLAEEINGHIARINALYGEGLALLRTGKTGAALNCFTQCRTLGRESRFKDGGIVADLGESEWLASLGRARESRRRAERAQRAARAAGLHEYLNAATRLIEKLPVIARPL